MTYFLERESPSNHRDTFTPPHGGGTRGAVEATPSGVVPTQVQGMRQFLSGPTARVLEVVCVVGFRKEVLKLWRRTVEEDAV